MTSIFTRHLLRVIVWNALWINGALSGIHESRLIDALLHSSLNTAERPVEDDRYPLKVEFMITIQQIIDVDEKNQVILTNLWQSIRWTDYKFRWNPQDYGNITDIRLPISKVWKPDILMYNSASSTFDMSFPTNVVVYHTGRMEQIPPGLFTSTCPIEIRWFPFDDQKCTMKFGSWTYDGTKIDLQLPEGQKSASTDGFSENGEWHLIDAPAERNVVLYDCCPDNPFYDITFTLHIRRRKLYYMVNIVAPCMMLSALTLLTFFIPPEAGEKISFGVTILLSLTVFLLLVAEALPATSDAIPLISIYFSSVMLLNALSVLFTVTVLSFHFRTGESHSMPAWVKRGVCVWLAWILRMRRPGHDLSQELRRSAAGRSRRTQGHRAANGTSGGSVGGRDNGMVDGVSRQDVELTERSFEETELLQAPTLASSPASYGYESCSANSSRCSPVLSLGHSYGGDNGHAVGGGVGCSNGGNSSFLARSNLAYSPLMSAADYRWSSQRSRGWGNQSTEQFSVTRYEVQAILREIRYITSRMRESDSAEAVTADWKFAAAVIDRLLLVVFSTVTLATALCILFSAPHFFEST